MILPEELPEDFPFSTTVDDLDTLYYGNSISVNYNGGSEGGDIVAGIDCEDVDKFTTLAAIYLRGELADLISAAIEEHLAELGPAAVELLENKMIALAIAGYQESPEEVADEASPVITPFIYSRLRNPT
jgi:hypothetical protein